MPLALQALLPLLLLLLAAGLVRARPRHPGNGWIAVGGAGLAGAVMLIELLRLSAGERVDVPYLTTFPYADLAIRLDPLSLGSGVVTLLTAALLMLVRVRAKGDRRDPWGSWLLTSAAALAVMLAASLLLAYILLQLVTLAWSGTVDEAAPRRRRLRLAIGLSDIGLLLAAAGAIQSVGTSAFSGVPSDTFGVAAFLLALLPVLARMLALGWVGAAPVAPVSLDPAIAFAAPAGYLLLRLLALMGGQLPGRPIEIAVFAAGLLLAAAAAAWSFLKPRGSPATSSLLVSQAGLALAMLASSLPLLALASTWLVFQLILLAGLCSVYGETDAGRGVVTRLTLAVMPGTTAFTSVFIAVVGLHAAGNALAVVAVVIVALLMTVAGIVTVRRLTTISIDVASGWALMMLAIAALPSLSLAALVLPAAQTVRSLPGGSILLSPLGFRAAGVLWPAPIVTLLLLAALLLAWRRRLTLVTGVPGLPRPAIPRARIPTLPRLPARWVTRSIWTAFITLTAVAVLRP